MGRKEWISCRRRIPPGDVRTVLDAANHPRIVVQARNIWEASTVRAEIVADPRLQTACSRVLSATLYLGERIDGLNARNAISEFVRFGIADTEGDLRPIYGRRKLCDVLLPLVQAGLRELARRNKLRTTDGASEIDISDLVAVRMSLRNCLRKVKAPAGTDPIAASASNAKEHRQDDIKLWIASGAEPSVALVAAVCLELAAAAGDEPFYLPATKDSALKLGIGHSTLADAITDLVDRGFLLIVSPANQGQQRARRFRLGRDWISFAQE